MELVGQKCIIASAKWVAKPVAIEVNWFVYVFGAVWLSVCCACNPWCNWGKPERIRRANLCGGIYLFSALDALCHTPTCVHRVIPIGFSCITLRAAVFVTPSTEKRVDTAVSRLGLLGIIRLLSWNYKWQLCHVNGPMGLLFFSKSLDLCTQVCTQQ